MKLIHSSNKEHAEKAATGERGGSEGAIFELKGNLLSNFYN